jgi:hypothetical protein
MPTIGSKGLMCAKHEVVAFHLMVVLVGPATIPIVARDTSSGNNRGLVEKRDVWSTRQAQEQGDVLHSGTTTPCH